MSGEASDNPMTQGRTLYGLIAGNGRFPFLILEAARERGIDVVVAAIKEETFPEIESLGYPVHWLGLGQLGKLIRLFKQAGVHKAIMAGQVKHARIFGGSIPDLAMIRMLAGLRTNNTDSLIGGVAEVLAKSGITLVDSTELLQENMATEGQWSLRALNAREQADVDYGRPIAICIAGMDLGQTIVVRDKAVVAIEAMEGTDATIRRAGDLVGRQRLTVIKVSKPGQDMRFDVPVVGPPTLRAMIESGATALVLDARRTLVLDRKEMLQLADQNDIAIVGFAPAK
jgi:DUF1009 family protein